MDYKGLITNAKIIKYKNMNFTMLKSGLVSGALMGVIAMAGYVIQLGDVFKVDWHMLVNAGSLAFMTTLVSVLKSLMTSEDGKFLGAVQVKDV